MADLTLAKFLEACSKFNNIKFYDAGHSYYIGDVQVLSVTGVLERFKKKFQYEEELAKKAEKEGVSKEILAKEWDYKREHALFEGVQIHRYLENILSNKDVVEERDGNDLVRFDQIERSFFIMKKYAWQFYEDYILSGKLIPVRSEFVVGCGDLETAGQMDELFWNTEVEALQVWDWKTNGKFRFANEYGNKLLHCLSHLDECELAIYSVQLKSYKYLFERATGVKLHKDCFIVWFNEHNQGYKVIKCLDVDDEVMEMFEHKMAHPEDFKPRFFERPTIPVYENQAVSFDNLLDLSSYI